MSNNCAYTNKSQQTLIKVIDALAVLPLQGRTLGVLQASVDGASRDQVFRALKNLEAAGWAEQAGEFWRVTPAITRLSEQVRIGISVIHHTYLHAPEK